LYAADSALAGNDPLGTLPLLSLAYELLIRAAAFWVIGFFVVLGIVILLSEKRFICFSGNCFHGHHLMDVL
jgi:hypothetical protein